MARIELTISDAYAENWGVYEGVREIIQNGLDAAQDGHSMDVRYRSSSSVLAVVSRGVRLDRSCLLLGVTSKRDGNYRGHYGEGLKLGALALTRIGRKMRVINDHESWSFQIEPSRSFGVPVLTVTTRTLPVPTGNFSVEISLAAEEWAEVQRRFRSLQPRPEVGTALETGATTILLDPSERGRCYVKGIYVETREDMVAGYDFNRAATDRDRAIIKQFDLEHYTARSWADAYKSDLVSPAQFLDLLMTESPESSDLKYMTYEAPRIHALVAEFAARYGERATPVSSPSEVGQVGHYGRVGIVSQRAADFFKANKEEAPLLCIESLLSARKTDVLRSYEAGELDSSELYIYTRVNGLVSLAAKQHGFTSFHERLTIVDFRDPEILGLSIRHPSLAGARSLLVARSQLSGPDRYLRTLVHELAHDAGGDGTVQHRDAESNLFSSIVINTCGVDWGAPTIAA